MQGFFVRFLHFYRKRSQFILLKLDCPRGRAAFSFAELLRSLNIFISRRILRPQLTKIRFVVFEHLPTSMSFRGCIAAVGIRSLNGYYGFLDSLRSLEMTTVTELFPIYRAAKYSNCRDRRVAERSEFSNKRLPGAIAPIQTRRPAIYIVGECFFGASRAPPPTMLYDEYSINWDWAGQQKSRRENRACFLFKKGAACRLLRRSHWPC